MVPTGPADPANRPERPQVADPVVLQLGGSHFVFERFMGHTWDDRKFLWLLDRWLGYGPDKDT